VRRFDVLVGKHGDHIGGERDAAKSVVAGEADAACMIDVNHLVFSRDGTLPAGKTRILAHTANYDHCNFTVLDGPRREAVNRFRDLLFSMSYEDPELRPFFDLEGLKEWKPGRVDQYALLERAIDRFGTIDSFLASFGNRCA